MEFPHRVPAVAVREAFPNPGGLSLGLSFGLSFGRKAKRSIESSRPRDIFDI
jgi:hypothetical protein